MVDDMRSTTPSRLYRRRVQGQRRELVGVVVSTKMSKTISVRIERTEQHRKYGKIIRRHTRVYAHDEKGEANVNDLVRVVECRPMSKLKRFRLAEILKPGS